MSKRNFSKLRQAGKALDDALEAQQPAPEAGQ